MARPSIRPGRAVRPPAAPGLLGEEEPVPVGPAVSPPGTGDSPRWALVRSGSVRASSMSTSARAAKVHQVFTPLISQPPSVRRRPR